MKDISFVFVFNNDSLKRSLRGKYKRVRVSKHRPYRQRVQFVNLGVTVRASGKGVRVKGGYYVYDLRSGCRGEPQPSETTRATRIAHDTEPYAAGKRNEHQPTDPGPSRLLGQDFLHTGFSIRRKTRRDYQGYSDQCRLAPKSIYVPIRPQRYPSGAK